MRPASSSRSHPAQERVGRREACGLRVLQHRFASARHLARSPERGGQPHALHTLRDLAADTAATTCHQARRPLRMADRGRTPSLPRSGNPCSDPNLCGIPHRFRAEHRLAGVANWRDPLARSRLPRWHHNPLAGLNASILASTVSLTGQSLSAPPVVSSPAIPPGRQPPARHDHLPRATRPNVTCSDAARLPWPQCRRQSSDPNASAPGLGRRCRQQSQRPFRFSRWFPELRDRPLCIAFSDVGSRNSPLCALASWRLGVESPWPEGNAEARRRKAAKSGVLPGPPPHRCRLLSISLVHTDE